jgi:hypothetical protein
MRTRGIHVRELSLIARRRLATACALCFAIVGIASIATRVFGDSLPFLPPAGWQSTQPPRGMLGVWVHPGDTDFRQNVVVGREPTQLSASAYAQHAVAALAKGLPGFQLGADENTTTCGGRPAHYLSYSSVIHGHQILYEQMSTLLSGYAWFAVYTRLMTQPSLPEARQSLTTLCGAVGSSSGAQPGPAGPAQPTEAPPTPTPGTPTPEPNPYATVEPVVDSP